MKSQYADYFNHDHDAKEYDLDVTREEDPIRTGYASLMAWLGTRAAPATGVLDLGAGTGNTIRALPQDCEVTAVDISVKMIEIAKLKLADRSVSYVIGDILDYITRAPLQHFDVIVSTYALHHLTPQEREHLFTAIRRRSDAHPHILVGDLMYRNEADRNRILLKFAARHPELAEEMDDEFFWDIERTTEMLEYLGWEPSWTKFSDLSWGVELLQKESAIPIRPLSDPKAGCTFRFS